MYSRTPIPPEARTITVDTRGLWHSIRLLLVVGVLVSIVYATVPMVRVAIGSYSEESGRDTESPLATAVTDADLAAWALSEPTEKPSVQVAPSMSANVPPAAGPFVRVDLVHGHVFLFQNGAQVAAFPITQVPQNGSPNSIPEGSYTVKDKEEQALSMVTLTQFPHYVRFDDRFAIHGPPIAVEGGDQAAPTSEGSIVIARADAAALYALVESGTPLYVVSEAKQDSPSKTDDVTVGHSKGGLPATSARAFIVADLDSGQVYRELQGSASQPIASITKLVTAVVANTSIAHTDSVKIKNGERYTVGDLYYPLFLRSDNDIADALAAHVGTQTFVSKMNVYVRTIGLANTAFADPSGLSPRNISTARDLAFLGKYLYETAPFLLDISSEESMTITSENGVSHDLVNQNKLAEDPHFIGGKLGFTDEAGQTALSLFSLPIDGTVRPVVVVILGSTDWKQDTRTLLRWLLENTKNPA